MNEALLREIFSEPCFNKQSAFYYLYIPVREREQRLYSDQQIAALPNVEKTHIHLKEWQIRKRSCKRLIRYLKNKNQPLKILEVGCGNGWLCHQLSTIEKTTVTGLDINFLELQQAEKVFKNQPNLSFVYGDLCTDILESAKFDIIVFAASLQYFQSLPEIINAALLHLKEGGEIHILDTHFYIPDELSLAKQRSAGYFSSLGYPQMVNYYFHHSVEELKYYQHQFLYNPHSFINKLFKKRNPFYWIRINYKAC